MASKLKFISQSNSATIAISKPPLLALLTNVGSSGSASWTVSEALFQPNENLVDVLTCDKVQATSQGGVSVQAVTGLPQVRSAQ